VDAQLQRFDVTQRPAGQSFFESKPISVFRQNLFQNPLKCAAVRAGESVIHFDYCGFAFAHLVYVSIIQTFSVNDVCWLVKQQNSAFVGETVLKSVVIALWWQISNKPQCQSFAGQNL